MEKLLPARPKHLQIQSRLDFQVSTDFSLDMKNKPWREVLPYILIMLKSEDQSVRFNAANELERMAFAADYFNNELLTNKN